MRIFQVLFTLQFSSVQFSHSVVSDSLRPHGLQHARQASLSITNSQSLLKLTSIESVMPSNHLILCHPLLLLPSIFVSIRVFSNELAVCIRWPKYRSFSISPSNDYSGLISFRKLSLLDIRFYNLLIKHILLKKKPCPRSGGCTGAGGPRGATPPLRSGGEAMRRYRSSKVGSSSCTFWSSHEEIPYVQGKRNPSKTVGVARGISGQTHKP